MKGHLRSKHDLTLALLLAALSLVASAMAAPWSAGKAAYDRGDYARAASLWSRPRSFNEHRWLASAHLLNGEYSQAVAVARRAISMGSLQPQKVEEFRAIAAQATFKDCATKIRAGRAGDALGPANALVALNPNRLDSFVILAEVLVHYLVNQAFNLFFGVRSKSPRRRLDRVC